MNCTNICEWYLDFKASIMNVHDKERSGLLSIMTDEMMNKIKETIWMILT